MTRKKNDTLNPPRIQLQQDEAWKDGLLCGKGGPKPLISNAFIAFRDAPEWAGKLRFDEFNMRTVVDGKLPIETINGHWTDFDDVYATLWLHQHEINVRPDVAGLAAESLARKNSFHPVRDYVDSLKWDGRERIKFWLSYYLNAPDTPYTRAIGAKWLISAIARIRQPGCQADHTLILEGPQGKMKSTALRTLAGEWFTDDLSDIGTKDAAMQTCGVWIIEMAELDSLSRADAKRAKAFLARRVDRLRPPYGRRLVEWPRQCVFAGTTNAYEYLQDETGGRRFWPTPVGVIDVDGIKADRDQLWAEAQAMYDEGKTWWIDDPSIRADAEREQSDRQISDTWDAEIASFCLGRTRVKLVDVLKNLHIDVDQQDQKLQTRAAKCLIKAGWYRRQLRVGKDREWFYVRPDFDEPVTTLDDSVTSMDDDKLL